MKRIAYVVLASALFLGASTVNAAENGFGQKLGVKVWDIDFSYQWPDANEVTGNGMVAGLTTSFDFPKDFWCSFYYMFGDIDYGSGRNRDSVDIEFLFCKTFDMLDVGGGVRQWTAKTTQPYRRDAEDTIFGPMLYVGLGDTFGPAPVGWYTSATWLFVDLEDDWDDGRHVILEGGIFLALDPISATLGYRGRYHYSQDNDVTYRGLTASVCVALW